MCENVVGSASVSAKEGGSPRDTQLRYGCCRAADPRPKLVGARTVSSSSTTIRPPSTIITASAIPPDFRPFPPDPVEIVGRETEAGNPGGVCP